MLGWLYRGVEHRVRARSGTTAKAVQHIPIWFIRKVRKAKLVRSLRHVYRNSAIQREAWKEAGVRFSDIRSPKVLQHIPFTTGRDLFERPDDFICVDRDELIHMICTSSTKGLQKKIYLTDEDLQHQARAMGTMMRRFPGVRRIAAMFLVQDPTWNVSGVIRRAIAEAGKMGFIAGLHRTIPEQIQLLKEYEIDYLITSPAYLGRLTYESPEDVGKLGLRYIQLGTQPWTEEFRQRMQKAWGATLIDGYGSNECVCGIATECIYQDGLHLSEVDYWVEIIDPKTCEPVPDGQEGEIVITTLSRRGMPLVRYRTGDVSYLYEDQRRCACGYPLRKIGRIKSRVDDMLIVGPGHNLYPYEIEDALFAIPGITDYQFVVDKNGHKDVIHLTVESANPEKNIRELTMKMLMGIRSIGLSHGISGTLDFGRVDAVAPGTLSRGRPKTIRIIDQRAAVS